MRQIAACHTCGLQHSGPAFTQEAWEFLTRHRLHHFEVHDMVPRGDNGELMMPYNFGKKIQHYGGNASVKQAVGTATAFTKTNANLASSATAGWMSNAIDNSSNLYCAVHVQAEYAAVNTAPANSKAIFFYAYSLINTGGSAYTSTGDTVPSGSEGTITFPDVTANAIPMPVLGVLPYPVQNKALNSQAMEVSKCFGGIMPPKWGIAKINHTGMTLSTTNIYYLEYYFTVV